MGPGRAEAARAARGISGKALLLDRDARDRCDDQLRNAHAARYQKIIFAKIRNLVEAAGGTCANVVKMTIFVVNIKNNTEVWRARREFFSGDFPASTLVEVRSLAGP